MPRHTIQTTQYIIKQQHDITISPSTTPLPPLCIAGNTINNNIDLYSSYITSLKYLTAVGIKDLLNISVEHRGINNLPLNELLSSLKIPFSGCSS